ncbi:unnamed protein product [Clavelina lepadiformis]|uniref:CxC2-like cysteine cluster KDZ transposase-associated domain-containing protein n=2 Tax=Clavelina lepadiformis TaxID=159417 RepID=A0ABP0EXD3_CLALP
MGNMFCKMVTPVRLLKRFDGHECQSGYTRHITVVDYKGFENVVSVQFCYCESEPETLLRLNLWTCSPKKPKLAVSIDLLKYFRALCLEKHLSTEGFCHALENRILRVPGYTAGVKSLSRVLLQEVVEAYRHHVYKLQHLHGLVSSDDIDTGTLCPACEGNPEGMRTYCLDANFGLVRRILSGSKSCDPHHKQSFFLNQNEVDSFVDTYDENKYGSASKNCNDFQAGSIIRSKSKSSKLAIKGVFGVCCKHEFPTMFFDLKHGERLAYAVLAIEKLLKRNENKIRVFYDIACKLKGHLQVRKNFAILNKITFAVPVFHSYGHIFSCQKQFNPRFLDGFGLTDGETVERLWAYLRGFNKISKEMKPEHRTDLLTDGLILYGRKIKKKLGYALMNKLKRASCKMELAKSELEAMAASYPGGTLTQHQLKAIALQPEPYSSAEMASFSWVEEYSLKLQEYYWLKEEVEDLTKEITSEILSGKVDQIAKLDSHLSKVEVENGILIRWDVKDDMMLKYLSSAVKKKRAEILENIYKLNIERKFLSTLIQKYPAGQTIVQRLVRSIRKVNNNIRHQITMYNKYQNVPQNEMKSITFEMVVGSGPVKNVPGFIEKKIKEQHCIRERCKEEMCHLKEDMTSVMNFYQKQINIVSNLVEGCEVVEPYVVTHQLQAEIELLSFINDIKGTVPFQANTPLLNEKLGTSDMAKLDPMEKEDDESESPINLSELQHILTEFGSESEGSDNEDEA